MNHVKRRTIEAETLQRHLEENLITTRGLMCLKPDREGLVYLGTALGLLTAMQIAGLIDAGEYVRRRRALSAEFDAKQQAAAEPADLILHFVAEDDGRFYVYQRHYEAAPTQLSDGFATVEEANAECDRLDEGCVVDRPHLVR